MTPTLSQQLLDHGGLPSAARRVVLEAARRAWRSTQARDGAKPLKGRHLAIAARDHGSPSALLFERAATGLGARVSHIGPEAVHVGDGRDEIAARLLGSLYDAVDCAALPAEAARQLQRIAGVPVFSDLGGDDSPLRALLPALALESPDDPDTLLHLVQAVLLETVA